MAEALHVLPYSGGLLEQPPGALFKMEAILAASAQPATAESNKTEAQQKLAARMGKSESGIRRS